MSGLKQIFMKQATTLLLLVLVAPVAVVAENPPLEVAIEDSPVKADGDSAVVSYAETLEQATPSVVSVYTARVVETSGMGGGRLPRGLPELFRQFGMPVPEQRSPGDGRGGADRRQRVGVGSGVIISEDGYIITNHHVIRDRRGAVVDEIRVRLGNRQEYEAELIGSDEKTDVAVLRIEAEAPLPALTLADSDNLRVGDVVFAIGNPLEVGLTATQGIVSATGRNSLGILGRGGYEDFIQTDAAINLGNSGGALIDARGRLVGINTAIVSGSGGNIGIGFAIPVDLALNVASNLIERGEVPRGLLGLYPESLNPELADAFGLDTTRGALVNQVQEGSPADQAGLRHGDVIVRIDDVDIESAPQLRLVVSQMMPGSEVDVTIIRNEEERVIPVTLGSVDGSVAESGSTGTEILEGVRLAELGPTSREAFSIPPEIEGVLVESVAFDSPYAEALTERMVLLEVNGEAVSTPEAVGEALEDGVNRLYTWLGGNKRFIVVRVEP